MKTNYMKQFMVALLLLLVIAPAAKSQITVSCDDLRQRGNNLSIDVLIKVDGSEFKKRDALSLIPVLTQGSQSLELPVILFNGRVSQKVYNRELDLNNLEGPQPYAVIPVEKGLNTVNYQMTIPFQPWMKGAELLLIPDNCACGGNVPGDPLLLGTVLTRPDVAYEPTVTLVYVTPEVEMIKQRAEVGTAYLDFVVAKSEILPNFRNNAVELAKIDQTIRTVTSDPNITLKGLILRGYASPEGNYQFNTKLAQDRVKALQRYIEQKHNFPASIFNVSSVPEDWDGFRKAVEANYDVPSRGSVLTIIDSNDAPDVKEQKLKALDGGKPYRYVLENIFPSLRRSDYQVDYIVREFTAEEGREIIKINPKQLSLSEMFAVANTYDEGTKEYNEVFAIALQLYPDDPVANLNAANVAISEGNFAAAAAYLAKAGNSAAAQNARGVLNLLEGNLDAAEQLFKQAQAAGIPSATLNLEELEKKRADNALFDSFK